MLRINCLKVNCVDGLTYCLKRSKRGIRSVRVAQERLKKLEEKYAIEEALIVAEKEKQLAEWKKQDEQKLIDWTAWRRGVEDDKAAKYVPLPMSLTGFGDGVRPRYWTLKLRKAFQQWAENVSKKSLTFADKIPASLEIYLKSNETSIDTRFKSLYDKLNQEKSIDSTRETSQGNENKLIQFPFELLNELKKSDPETAEALSKPKTFPSGLVDREYEDFLKHHNFVQNLAINLQKITPIDYEDEIRSWGAELWRRNYGSPNPNIKPSSIACGGCGAYLHCNDRAVPGYIPSEVFTKLSESELRKRVCQRCDYLHSYNVSIDVNVPSDLYPSIISEIKQKTGIVIIMVDMTDFPGSIWPNIIQLIGKSRKIYIVGNKVDLLPKDGIGYLDRIEKMLKQTVREIAGFDENTHIRYAGLISAKTGYGVENLVTRLLNDDNGTRDIYLIGCTNVGKSTLFNALLQSDLCAARSNDLIQRATTSLWPGTTLNLLRFPINQLRGWLLSLRKVRLKRHERLRQKEKDMRLTLYRQTNNPRLAVLSDRIDTSFRENVPFKVESGHPMATMHNNPRPFDPKRYALKNYRFFYDTPGAIYKEQLLTLLTTEELIKTIPRETIVPRTFSLWPFQTLFIAGLGRIDVVHARSNILLTVFASHYLPIHVTFTEQAKQFYQTFIGTEMLGVPIGSPERLSKWPILIPKEIDLTGIGWRESCADVVLSSAGWVSVTADDRTGMVLRAFTPEGRGIYVRQPSLLPFAVNLRGRKIKGTPCFEAGRTTVDNIGDDGYLIGEKAKDPQKRLPEYKEETRTRKDNLKLS